jgi:anti-sigma factor RsiW
MAKLNQKLLARYYDGELSPRKARKIEQLLSRSPEHQEALKKMTQIGELLRLANEEKLESVSFERLEQQVAAGISREEDSSPLEQLKVWFSEFFSYRKVVWVPTAVVAGATLAVLLILPLTTPTPVVEDKAPTGDRNGTWMASDDTSKGGSKIESVTFDDTGDSKDSKFEVSKIDGQNGSIGVVWIVDTP